MRLPPRIAHLTETLRQPRVRSSAVGRRANLIVFAIGLAFSACFLAWLAALPRGVVGLSDFTGEAWPAYQALNAGHIHLFAQIGPPYTGSLVLRAPFELISRALGGGVGAAYFASGLPCLAAGAALCAWLSAQPRLGGGVDWVSRINPVLLLFFNPVLLGALILGHPEELLGAALGTAAVVLATRGQERWAAVLLGLAVVNKASALVAAPVVLLVMPGRARIRAGLLAALTTGAVLIPLTLLHGGGLSVASAGNALGIQSVVWLPPQLLWWFGPHSIVAREAHPLIVAVACGCAGLWLVRRGIRSERAVEPREALLLLSLVLFLRAALDPLNNLYYELPFVLGLMAYEICAGRTPILTFLFSVLITIVVPPAVLRTGDDLHAALFAAMALPTIAWLVLRLEHESRPAAGGSLLDGP